MEILSESREVMQSQFNSLHKLKFYLSLDIQSIFFKNFNIIFKKKLKRCSLTKRIKKIFE